MGWSSSFESLGRDLQRKTESFCNWKFDFSSEFSPSSHSDVAYIPFLILHCIDFVSKAERFVPFVPPRRQRNEVARQGNQGHRITVDQSDI